MIIGKANIEVAGAKPVVDVVVAAAAAAAVAVDSLL